jgi:hypothetical protein
MMVSVQRSIEIRVPVHTLYNQLTQFEEYPQFMHDIESVEQVDDTHLHWKAKTEDGAEEWDAVITEQVPDQCIAWHTECGPSNAGKVELQSVGSASSRLTLTMVTERDPQPTTPAGDIKAEMSEKIWEDLTRLRNMVESRGQESGAWRGEVHNAQVTMQDRSSEKQSAQGGDVSPLAGQESGLVAGLGVMQGTGEQGNTAGRDGIDEVAKLGSIEGMEHGKGSSNLKPGNSHLSSPEGKSASQSNTTVAELGVAQGTGQAGNTAGRDGIDEVASLGSVEGMEQGNRQQAGEKGQQAQKTQQAQHAVESLQRDRGSPGNPIPSSGLTELSGSSQNAAFHQDPGDSAFRQVSMPQDEQFGHEQDNGASQSDYSLSQGAQGNQFSIAEEVSFDQQSDEARRVGQLPQDDEEEGNTGVPRYDAIGKALQRGRPEPEV